MLLVGPGGYHCRCVVGLVPVQILLASARVSTSLLIRADLDCHTCAAYQRFPRPEEEWTCSFNLVFHVDECWTAGSCRGDKICLR